MTKEEFIELGWVTPTDIHNLIPRISIAQIRENCLRIRNQMRKEGKNVPYANDNRLVVPAKRIIKEYELWVMWNG